MTKKSLLLVVLLTIYSFTNSQEISLGMKGGVNYNSNRDIKGRSSGGSYTTDLFAADKEMGTQYGAFLDISFGKIFLRPEVLFTSLKNTYAFPTKPANWSATRMDIPVMLGVHIYGPASIVAGPVFSSVSDFEMEGLDDWSDPIIYDESTMNLQIGILLEFGRFGLDLRYEYGLKKVELQEAVDFTHGYNGYGINLADLYEYNPSQIILSVHIGILRFSTTNERKNRSRSDWRNHKRL